MDETSELLEACQTWMTQGYAAGFESEHPVLTAANLTPTQCQQILAQAAAGQQGATLGQAAARAPSQLRVPNFLKSESLWFVVFAILAPLLIIGFYTDWSYQWQSTDQTPADA
jgi:hypothetical protein